MVGIGLGPNDQRRGLWATPSSLTPAGLERSQLRGAYRNGYLAVQPGTLEAFMADHASDLEIERAGPPDEVTNLASLGFLPLALGAFIGLIGIGALANALVVTTQQRRRDLGALRALGMTGRQLRRSVVVAGASIALVGVLIGLPLGMAVGGSVWRVVASTAFVAEDPAWQFILVVVPLVTVALGALVGIVPGMARDESPTELVAAV